MTGGFIPGAWNFGFVGCTGDVPESQCGQGGYLPATTTELTPKIAEKPYITINDNETYTLNIPPYKTNSSGVAWTEAEAVDFNQVYVASDTDSAATINSML